MSKNKRNPRNKWYFHGFTYHKKYTYFNKHLKKYVTYVTCIRDNSKINKCNVGGCVINNNLILRKNMKHNHSPNPMLSNNLMFSKVMEKFSGLPFVKPSQIIKVMKRDQPDVTSSLSLSALRKRVQRSKSKQNPVTTNIKLSKKTLLEFGQKLHASSEELKYGFHKEHQLTTKVLSFGTENSKHEHKEATVVIIYDAELLEKISPLVDIVCVDATFKSFPDLHVKKGQLLTVMAQLRTTLDCQKAIPCMWVLMDNSTTDCYHRVFQFLADNFKKFNPRYSMSDYEIAIRNALKKVFPQIQTRTCYFHYAQALVRNAQQQNIIDAENCKTERPELHIFLHRLKLLALLPAEYIQSTYEAIKLEYILDFRNSLDEYLAYYERQWLKSEGAKQISVYRVQNRTNNYIESYHKQLNDNLKKRPNHNIFIGTIKSVAMESNNLLTVIIDGKYEGREQKKDTTARNVAIEELWTKVESLKSLNEAIDSQRLLQIIDEMPEIEALKRIEEEKLKELIDNVKEEKDGFRICKRLGLITIRKNGDNSDMIKQLKRYRRQCLALDETIGFKVEYTD